jgi:hypothetical protein
MYRLGKRPTLLSPTVTAGLTCAPEILPKIMVMMKSASPFPNATNCQSVSEGAAPNRCGISFAVAPAPPTTNLLVVIGDKTTWHHPLVLAGPREA